MIPTAGQPSIKCIMRVALAFVEPILTPNFSVLCVYFNMKAATSEGIDVILGTEYVSVKQNQRDFIKVYSNEHNKHVPLFKGKLILGNPYDDEGIQKLPWVDNTIPNFYSTHYKLATTITAFPENEEEL